jgi:alpha-galactosidase
MPGTPIYGGNNWYYTYGEKCSAAGLLRDSELLAGLSPAGGNRPFMVIDDGWEPTRLAGPWDRGNAGFPDLPGLASGMSRCGVRPGIWLRPLCTSMPLPDSWRLRYEPPSQSGAARFSILDPSLPEVLDTVRQDIHRLGTWGFELLKHDFSTYDILGRWGFAMNAELTGSGWHFADRSRTTAEIVGAFYRAIRGSAGTAIIIGCNTLGHLAAGLFELQRIGDDTSGREFHRTRRMGVNTLAFRAPQHGAFFAVDADCAAITPQVPWQMAGRWLDLLSRSGTPLFVSADLAAIGPEQKQSLQLALARASKPQPLAEPLDWMQTTTPAKWRFRSDIAEYDWYGPEGDTPFPL